MLRHFSRHSGAFGAARSRPVSAGPVSSAARPVAGPVPLGGGRRHWLSADLLLVGAARVLRVDAARLGGARAAAVDAAAAAAREWGELPSTQGVWSALGSFAVAAWAAARAPAPAPLPDLFATAAKPPAASPPAVPLVNP